MIWPEVGLAEVANVFNGKTPSKAEQKEQGHPILKIKNVSDNRKFKGIFESFVDIDLAAKSESKFIKLNDTLILNAAHNADYVGSKQYRAEPEVINSLPTGEWLVVRSKAGKTDPIYLSFWLLLGLTRFKIRNLVKGIHLYPKDVARLKIPLPSLAEQQKIAAILDAADSLRQKDRQLIDHYTTLSQSLFLEMFGDPVTNPMGWEKDVLKNIGSVSTGNTPPRANPKFYGNHIEWIKTNNINTPNMHLTLAEEYLSADGLNVGRSVEPNSLLVTCIAGSKHVIGNVAIVDRKVAFNQQINSFSPFSGNILYYYYLCILGKKHIQSFSTNSMKGMISKSKFESIDFICPPIPLQDQFAERIKHIEAQKQQAQVSVEKSEALFNSLLHRAFNGELSKG